MHRSSACLLLAMCAGGCRAPSREQATTESRRLRASLERHNTVYLKSIEAEKALISETLAWLDGPIETRDRALLAAEAGRFADRWARVYFMPREIHAALKQEQYTAPTIQAAHERVLGLLKSRYFTLHDYQRYAQHASESDARTTPPGRMPEQLAELKSRLRAHTRPRDEISPVLAQLP